jgi:hypothetical protein
MGSKERHYTSSGSKSRDTRGEKPSQEDIRAELQGSRAGKRGATSRARGMEHQKETRH